MKVVRTQRKLTHILSSPLPLSFNQRQVMKGRKRDKYREPFVLHKPVTVKPEK